MEFSEFGEFFGQMPPILVFNVCMVFTLITGLLIYFAVVRPTMVSRRRKSRDSQQSGVMSTTGMPDLDQLTPAPAPVRRAGEYAVLLNDGETAHAVEVLTILRDTADDRLIIQLDNTGYRTLVDHPQVKARFTTLMKELAETIAKADTVRADTTRQDVPVRPAATPRPVVEPVNEPTNTPEPYSDTYPDDFDLPDLDTPEYPSGGCVITAPDRRAKRPQTNGGTAVPGAALPNYRDQANSEPKITKQGIFRPPKVEFAPLPELNLANAIEAYLQHKLYATQDFPGRDIHVHSAPGGGVRIQVDEMYYDAVGDIDEPEIREYIATTIEEWQDQQ